MGLLCSETALKPSRMSSLPTIPVPSKPSEFELQAELYFELKRKGLDVRGEVPSRLNGRKSIFDLAIFVNKQAAVIIEVKNSPCLALLNGKQTRQAKKYNDYGLPVIFHTSIHSINETVERVLNALQKLELL
jgi:hypothetical protein